MTGEIKLQDNEMKVIADFSMVPIGVGISVSKYIAECEKIFKRAGIKIILHS